MSALDVFRKSRVMRGNVDAKHFLRGRAISPAQRRYFCFAFETDRHAGSR